MGIWQVFALSNVLQLPVFSVYPHLGNTFVRTNLHRLILPRVCAEENAIKVPLVIMWTTTRCDMNVTHWVPNQSEPALPNAPQLETDISDVNADQNTLEEKPDTPEMKTKKMKPSTPEIKLDIPGMKMDTPDKKTRRICNELRWTDGHKHTRNESRCTRYSSRHQCRIGRAHFENKCTQRDPEQARQVCILHSPWCASFRAVFGTIGNS